MRSVIRGLGAFPIGERIERKPDLNKIERKDYSTPELLQLGASVLDTPEYTYPYDDIQWLIEQLLQRAVAILEGNDVC